MKTIMITGASRGIGLEFVRQYNLEECRIFACCRTPETAKDLNIISGQSRGRVTVHQLNVDNGPSIAGLKAELGNQPFDVLINNAGIMGQRNAVRGDIDYEAWQGCIATNVFGPMRVAEAFANNVVASEQKKLIIISSRMGSIGETTATTSVVYRSSKAAVNMVMKILANDLGSLGVIVTSFHPGWVRTDMGGSTADISVEESANGIRRVIAKLNSNDNGQFRNYNGENIQW